MSTGSPGYEVREAAASFAAGAARRAAVGGFEPPWPAPGWSAASPGAWPRWPAPRRGAARVDAGVEIARWPAGGEDAGVRGGRPRTGARPAAGSSTPRRGVTSRLVLHLSQAGRALLGTRRSPRPWRRELYSPPAGATGVFRRRKLARLVVTAGSSTSSPHARQRPRLRRPLRGGPRHRIASWPRTRSPRGFPISVICTEPQGRDQGADRRAAPTRCASASRPRSAARAVRQLYDLTSDLLKLISYPRRPDARSPGRFLALQWTAPYTWRRDAAAAGGQAARRAPRAPLRQVRAWMTRAWWSGRGWARTPPSSTWAIATWWRRPIPSPSRPTRLGWYALHVNANDLAVRGARPLWFLATVLLPEGKRDRGARRDAVRGAAPRRARSWAWRWSAATPR